MTLIRDILRYQIYTPTLYEIADEFSSEPLSDLDVENLLLIWTQMKHIQNYSMMGLYEIYYDLYLKPVGDDIDRLNADFKKG